MTTGYSKTSAWRQRSSPSHTPDFTWNCIFCHMNFLPHQKMWLVKKLLGGSYWTKSRFLSICRSRNGSFTHLTGQIGCVWARRGAWAAILFRLARKQVWETFTDTATCQSRPSSTPQTQGDVSKTQGGPWNCRWMRRSLRNLFSLTLPSQHADN